MANVLYTYPDNFRAQKILVAAKYSGEQVKVLSNPPDFKLGETNKTDDFLRKFPVGKVPALETKTGDCIFETNAILQYVSNEQLLGGQNKLERALVQQWVNFADHEVLPAVSTWVFPSMSLMQYNKQNTEKAKESLTKYMGVLNDHLKRHTFLVGERVTLADISVAINLLSAYQRVFDEAFRGAFPNANRWFLTVVNQPNFKEIAGEVQLCVKAEQFDGKKFQALMKGGDGGATDAAPKKEKKPAQAATPKKKEAKPKDDVEEEDDVPRPSAKDPFAALPVGTMKMDDWKKVYSNEDTIKVAMPWLEANFDAANYSFWTCEYLYPDELKMTFMSSNLIGGMFQRLDRMRKNAFGSMIIFGESNKSTISGVWMWRGQELAFTLSEDLQVDYESYSWKKLDWNNAGDKKRITEYFDHKGDFDGKQYNQGKIFK